MEQQDASDWGSHFSSLKDPRVERTKRHKLLDIIIIAISGTICGSDGWVEIEHFGKEKEAWLRTILGLSNLSPTSGILDPAQRMKRSISCRHSRQLSFFWERDWDWSSSLVLISSIL